jgi:hypothetical protein
MSKIVDDIFSAEPVDPNYAKYLDHLQKIVWLLNEDMSRFGFDEKIILKNEHITIEEDKIYLRLPVTINITISRTELDKK